jgi:hypothetical protein
LDAGFKAIYPSKVRLAGVNRRPFLVRMHPGVRRYLVSLIMCTGCEYRGTGTPGISAPERIYPVKA